MSNLFSLGKSDFIKGLIVAILAPVFMALANILNAPGFNFETLDWVSLLKIGFIAGLSYLAKNFFSDSEGKVLGKIG